MSLHPTMKRRLHERLHPVIGEEETDALLDQISPTDPITREWLDDRFVTKEHLDLKLESMEHRITGSICQAIQQQTHRVYAAAGVFALIISIVDRIWG